MSAPGALLHSTGLFVGSADPSQPMPEEFFDLSKPTPLQYHDFSLTIHHCSPLPDSTKEEINIFSHTVTPYNATEFQADLYNLQLSNCYPLLVQNLTHGFPIGNMPFLDESIIEPNHNSVDLHFHVVEKYLGEELSAGHMSEPFLLHEAECICWGPVVVSPLIVVVQDQGPGIPPKYWVCWNLSKSFPDHPPVNYFINKEVFPTCFDSASRMAELVTHNTGPISKYEDDIHIGRQPIQTISKHTQPSSSNKNLTHDLPTIPATSTLSTPPFNISAISPTLIAEDDDNIYIYKYDKGIMMDRIRKLNTPWHVLKGDVTFVWMSVFVGFLWDLPHK
uniref:Uncharacterized protein n=1 Tax=Moniliophthora roreri TaxID=221103 RepID=A0A0W0GFH9_MONRR